MDKERTKARLHKNYLKTRAKILDRSRKHNLKKKYDLTLDQYLSLLNKQNNVCAICGGTDSKALNVDHDHTTGKIRGLLCIKCNTALGLLKEDKDIIRRALQYIEMEGVL